MALDKHGNVIPAFRPDNPDMYGGGRMANFIATIERGYLGPFHGKSSTKYQLSGYMKLSNVVMADGSEHDDMTRRWGAGFFTSDFGVGTYPSNDGVNPVGGTIDDYKALASGEASIQPGDDSTDKQWTPEEAYRGVTVCGGKVRPGSDWDQLMQSIFVAPVDGQDEGTWQGWGNDVTCLHGLRVEFILGKAAKGKSEGDDDFKPLVVARILSGPGTPAGGNAPASTASASTAKPATASAASKPATPSTSQAQANGGANADLDGEIAALLVAEAERLNGPVSVMQAAQLVMKAKGPQAVQRVKEKSVHEAATMLAMVAGKSWVYDGVKMTLTGAAAS